VWWDFILEGGFFLGGEKKLRPVSIPIDFGGRDFGSAGKKTWAYALSSRGAACRLDYLGIHPKKKMGQLESFYGGLGCRKKNRAEPRKRGITPPNPGGENRPVWARGAV